MGIENFSTRGSILKTKQEEGIEEETTKTLEQIEIRGLRVDLCNDPTYSNPFFLKIKDREGEERAGSDIIYLSEDMDENRAKDIFSKIKNIELDEGVRRYELKSKINNIVSLN